MTHEDGSIARPFQPVAFRLVGSLASVTAYLNMLERFFDLDDVSMPEYESPGQIRVEGTMRRRHHLTGGDFR